MSKNWSTASETTLITPRPEEITRAGETGETAASPVPRMRLRLEELEARAVAYIQAADASPQAQNAEL